MQNYIQAKPKQDQLNQDLHKANSKMPQDSSKPS